MKTSKHLVSELTDDQAAEAIDDEAVIESLHGLVEVLADAGGLPDDATDTIDKAISLIKVYNSALLDQEDRRGEAIKGFHHTNEEITELENIIGGDRDLATGYACLRTEDGDAPGDVLVFLRGTLLGQISGSDEIGYQAIVKRRGKISQIKYDKYGKAMTSVIMQNADIIGMGMENSGKAADELMDELLGMGSNK